MNISRTAAIAATWSIAAGLGATAAMAAPSVEPWVGTWKLDSARSKFTGDTMTVSKTANGMYHYSDGASIAYDFGVDGKDYPSFYGRTTSWTAQGDHGWDSVSKKDGTVLYKVHRELSDGDKTLTETVTGAHADGSPMNETTVYTRVSGDTGLAGKWRDVKSNAGSPDRFVVSSPTPGTLHWDVPQYQYSVEGKPDGTDLPVSGGKMLPPGMTFSAKLESPNKLAYSIKMNGKPDSAGVQTLSADGKSYTDVGWQVGKPDEKSTAVYIKQ